MNRNPNTQTVQWFLELDAHGQLDLDPKYQRRSVWNDEYRRFFIDTVIKDFPAPPIYLQVDMRPGKLTVYHVIDGKQRLEAILAFSKDEFGLGIYSIALGSKDTAEYYSELPDAAQKSFGEYRLTVESITQASPSELQMSFDRLNRNVAKLNSQELRNAQFDGAFISKMVHLSQNPFWETIGQATKSRIRRMLDVEFVSELYALTMHGIQDGKEVLDTFYARYDEDIPDEEECDSRFVATRDWLAKLPLDWKKVRFRNQADLYALWAAIDELGQAAPKPSPGAKALEDFQEELELLGSTRSRAYSDAVRQGSNKEANRKIRAEILQTVLQEA